MSAKIDETTGKITLTRGDTLWATSLPTYRDGTPYQKQEDDAVRFALKNAQLLPDGSDFVNPTPLLEVELEYDDL